MERILRVAQTASLRGKKLAQFIALAMKGLQYLVSAGRRAGRRGGFFHKSFGYPALDCAVGRRPPGPLRLFK